MSTSKVRPIKDVALGIYDGPHATPKESPDGPVFLGIKNITEDGRLDLSDIRHISEHEFPRWTRRVTPQAGDIVFTYEATLHRYAMIPEGFRGCLGRRVALVRPDPAKVYSQYLLYYFLSQEWKAVVEGSVITGATVDRIPIIRFPDFPVSLPEIPIQKRIASIISTYDAAIENNLRRIALLEKAARLIYDDWFVRLRFPGYEHTRIVDGVPEGWDNVLFEQALVLQRGFDLTMRQRQDGDIPVYGSTGLNGYHNKAKAAGPGVVTGRSGTLGKVHYVEEDYWPHNTALWVREFKKVTPLFALFLMRGMRLEQYNGGVSVPTLDRKAVHRVPVCVPSRHLLELFDQAISPMFDQMSNLGKQNEKLKQARDLLLPRLMSGEIVV